MKIYTKTGDKGMTSLADGRRVEKKCERLEAYGTIDELNSQLGLLMTYCTDEKDKRFLTEIQRVLFIIGGSLAGAKTDKALSAESMEAEIDRLTAIVEEAQEDKRFHFILPGGSRAAAIAHVCRTVCRRAERAMLKAKSEKLKVKSEDGDLDGMLRYVNRLSDYLFILARKLNVDNNTKDVFV
ncbi:MAG: cob(I)yrinic acid a,c-diamide adenosyltransferase [Prevotella sp.]|nr:cob(I)yrinic acid a,c-diamide adenosyltransferase [Prevotella sp.]